MEIIGAYVAAASIMITSLSGVIFTNKILGRWMNYRIDLLVSMAAGTFAYLVYNLSLESIELLGTFSALIIIIGSAATSWIMFEYIPFFHHHHAESADHDHPPTEARRILFADAIHNVGDGIILATAFSIDSYLGLITAVGIFIHEFVQELSEYFILRKNGLSNYEALIKNFYVSATIIIGVTITLLIDQLPIQPYLLAISAGIFLTIVIKDLVPDTIMTTNKPGKAIPYLAAFIIGISLLSIINNTLGHKHQHEEHENITLSSNI